MFHTLEVYQPDIKDNGQVRGGGVSIYYSHAFELFFNYASGESFLHQWNMLMINGG